MKQTGTTSVITKQYRYKQGVKFSFSDNEIPMKEGIIIMTFVPTVKDSEEYIENSASKEKDTPLREFVASGEIDNPANYSPLMSTKKFLATIKAW